MSTRPIHEFISQTEENLRIAEAVSEALPKARHDMAMKFLAQLDLKVKERFPDWKSSNDGSLAEMGSGISNRTFSRTFCPVRGADI